MWGHTETQGTGSSQASKQTGTRQSSSLLLKCFLQFSSFLCASFLLCTRLLWKIQRKVPEETKWYSEIAITFKRWLILRFNFLLELSLKGRQSSISGQLCPLCENKKKQCPLQNNALRMLTIIITKGVNDQFFWLKPP